MKKGMSKATFIIILVSLILVLLIYPLFKFLLPKISKDECSTRECFIQAANSCEKSSYSQTEDGSTFLYEAENCMLTKTASVISEDEPREIKDLFEGKSLTCTYSENNFNENWINTLSLDLEDCEGQLKDSIEEIASLI